MKTEDLAKKNMKRFLRDGPRISSGYDHWVIARDPEKGMILLGGLGAMGCGSMWTRESEFHKELDGYTEAEIKNYREAM
jgi:hypothetical protein